MYQILLRVERNLGALDAKVDSIGTRIALHDESIGELKTFKDNIKGKVAVVGMFSGVATSALAMWIKSHFFTGN